MGDEEPVPDPLGATPASAPTQVVCSPPLTPTWPPEYFVPVDPAARKAHGTLGWDLLLALTLTVSAVALAFLIVDQLWFLFIGEALWGMEFPVSQWVVSLLVLVAFGVVPFTWVWGTRQGGWRGALVYLGLTRPWPAVAHGVGYAALLGGVVLWMLLGLEVIVPEPVASHFLLLTWGSAVAIATIAAFSEEVLFRGVLQKWVGVWGQAYLFGLAHLHIAVATSILAFFVGLLFGFLVKNGRSLWTVIVAHGVYNMFIFSLAILDVI